MRRNPLKKLYKTLPAIEFGSLQFKAVRQAMIEFDWARTTINANAKRIVRMFKWAASEGKLPPAIYEALRLIPSLKAGRTTAREPAAIKPVTDLVVTETCKHLPPAVSDMVRLQLLLSCLPSEVCLLTPAMIYRSTLVGSAAYRATKRAITVVSGSVFWTASAGDCYTVLVTRRERLPLPTL